MSELRFTDTNSANDSRGRALGLEGNDFVYVLAAFVASLGMYLVFSFVLRFGLAIALIFSTPIFLVVTAWVLFLRRNRPDGYAEDFIDDLVNREGWSFAKNIQPQLPAEEPHAQ